MQLITPVHSGSQMNRYMQYFFMTSNFIHAGYHTSSITWYYSQPCPKHAESEWDRFSRSASWTVTEAMSIDQHQIWGQLPPSAELFFPQIMKSDTDARDHQHWSLKRISSAFLWGERDRFVPIWLWCSPFYPEVSTTSFGATQGFVFWFGCQPIARRHRYR